MNYSVSFAYLLTVYYRPDTFISELLLNPLFNYQQSAFSYQLKPNHLLLSF